MPKRKRSKNVEDDLVTLMRKVKKLKRKIRREKHCVSESESSDSTNREIPMRSSAQTQEVPTLNPNLNPDDWVPDPSDHVIELDSVDNPITEDIDNTQNTSSKTLNDTVCNPTTDTTSHEPILSPVEPQLDEDILEILGDDPTTEVKHGNDIRTELANRLQHISREGLAKENRKNLLLKYPTPVNCLHIGAPQINLEIKAALPEASHKRDKGIEAKQKQMACAISYVADIITSQLNSKDKNNELLQKLMDLSRLLCDIQHADSATRRNFILMALKKDLKEHLTNTSIDTFLFGEKLSETLRSAKAVNKSGIELKADSVTKSTVRNSNTPVPKPLNRKAPVPMRRPPGQTQRSREPAAPRVPPPSTYYNRTPWQRPLPPPPPPPPAPAYSVPQRRRY